MVDTTFAPGHILPYGDGGTTTGPGPWRRTPGRRHLFTYRQPGFAANAASFYGLVIPVSAGRRAIVGVPVWSSKFKVKKAKRKAKGKTFADFAVSFGFGGAPFSEIMSVGVIKIWANNTLIYDTTNSTGASLGADIRFAIYGGAEDQEPDPVLSAAMGEDSAIAFRGEVYIMFYDFPLTDYGFTEIPFIRAELQDSFQPKTIVAPFTSGDAIPISTEQLTMDLVRSRFYAFDETDITNLRTFNIDNRSELYNYPLEGMVARPRDGGFYAEPFFGYVMATTGALDSAPINTYDPSSGSIVDSFGTSSGATSNTTTSFVSTRMFCAVRSNMVGMTSGCVVCVGFNGQLGVLEVQEDGSLTYAWHAGNTARTTHSDFSALTGTLRTVCIGDYIQEDQNAAAYFVASEREVCRGTVKRVGAHWDGSLYIAWTAPEGRTIQFVFTDTDSDDIIVFTRDDSDGNWFFTRLRVGAEDFTGAASSSEVYTGGPIPPLTDTDLSDERHPGWDYSDFTGTGKLGYINYLTNESTVLNLADGSFSTIDLVDWALEGGEIDASPFQITSNNIYIGPGEYFLAKATDEDLTAKVYPALPADLPIRLSNCLRWMMLYGKFEASEIFVSSDINDEVYGYIVEEEDLNIWDMLDDMGRVFRFDAFESENAVKMTKFVRGTSLTVDVTLDPQNDLMSISGDSEGKGDNQISEASASNNAAFSTERDWNDEVPETIEIRYIDKTSEYTVNLARSKKTKFPVKTTANENIERLDVPIIMTPTQALAFAAKTLYDLYTGQVQHEARLSVKHMLIEPGNTFALSINDMDYTLKITETTLNADYSTSVRGQSFARIDSIAFAGEDAIHNTQVIAGPAASDMLIFDTPPLTGAAADNQDAAIRVYTQITSFGQSGWLGARVMVAPAADADFVQKYIETSNGAVVLKATAALPYAPALVTDYVNTITANMLTNTPDNTGYLLVGAPGRWELIKFGDCQTTGTVAVFSQLVRGLRGTEYATGLHLASDKIVQLGSTVRLVSLDASVLNASEYFKAVGTNMEPDDVPFKKLTMTGNFEKPFAPNSLKATLDGSDIDLTWLRATRLDTHLGDGEAVPLEFVAEEYELEILDAPGGNVVRLVTGLSVPEYTYLSADIISDGIGTTTLYARVYQISPIVGRGWPREVTVDVL